jgi:4,5-dihydroxyphthalate decarboxylase
MSGGGRKTLKTLIGTYPHTAPLKSSALRSDRLDFEFTEIVPVWDGFKGMIRDDKYDVSEMAVVTYLLAKANGKPLALLPAAMVGRFQHSYAIYNASKGRMTPADLKGKRVGIRSFTTTTGAWIRGILANDYGVDLDSIQWVTFEEPHVAEYKDTTQCARRRGGPGRRPRSLSDVAGGQADGRPGSNSGHNSVRCRSQPAEPRDDCGVCVPAAPAAAPGLG